MANGLPILPGLGAGIMSPALPDFAAIQKSQQQQQEQQLLQQQAAQKKQANQLAASLILGERGASGLAKLAHLDAERAIEIGKAIGIPFTQEGRTKHFFGSAQKALIANKAGGGDAGLQVLKEERAFLDRFEIDSPRLNRLIGTWEQDPAAGAASLATFVKGGEIAGILKNTERVSDKEVAETEKLQAETAKIKADALRKTPKENLELERLKVDILNKESLIKERKAKAVVIAKQADKAAIGQAIDARTGIDAVNTLLDDSLYKSIYGFGGTIPFTVFPSSVKAEAFRDQIIGILSVENRQKLKGQGTITDQEAKTLEKAASVLLNPRIPDVTARKELERVKKAFKDAETRAVTNKAALDALARFDIDTGDAATGDISQPQPTPTQVNIIQQLRAAGATQQEIDAVLRGQ